MSKYQRISLQCCVRFLSTIMIAAQASRRSEHLRRRFVFNQLVSPILNFTWVTLTSEPCIRWRISVGFLKNEGNIEIVNKWTLYKVNVQQEHNYVGVRNMSLMICFPFRINMFP
jgi:hypothetical protein